MPNPDYRLVTSQPPRPIACQARLVENEMANPKDDYEEWLDIGGEG